MKSIVYLTALAGTMMSLNAFANVGDSFKCISTDPQGSGAVTLNIISRTQVSVEGSDANLDPNYDPRLNHGMVRFEYAQSDEGTTEVLVDRGLVYLATQGRIKIQNRGEGFSSETFSCQLQ